MNPTLEPIVEGPAEGKPLLFVHGWPDDAGLWDRQVGALADRYRCVRVTMPNFDGKQTTPRGHTTDEIVEALADVIRTVSPQHPVALILHDWGCYWGHLLHRRHPDLVERVAGLDVSPHVKPGPLAALGIVAYQWWLIAAFVIGGPIGNWMTRAFAGLAGAPAPRARIHSGMNYPYRNMWRDIFGGSIPKEMETYWPEVPLLFAYGKQKPLPFHSGEWTRHVEAQGGTVAALDCGHWVPEAPELADLLRRWLESEPRDANNRHREIQMRTNP